VANLASFRVVRPLHGGQKKKKVNRVWPLGVAESPPKVKEQKIKIKIKLKGFGP